MSDSMSATEYRKLIGATSGPSEMTAEQFRQMQGNASSVADYVGRRNLDSSEVNTESPGKVTFRQWLQHAVEQDVVEEHCGIPGRRFRFDWAIPSLMVAFEYDGVTHHATEAGSERDAEKGNLAQLYGWLFIRVNAKSVKSGMAFEHAEHAILKRLEERA